MFKSFNVWLPFGRRTSSGMIHFLIKMAEIKASLGDYVRIDLARKSVEGRILESHEKDIVLLKLNSGYNIGISRENIHGFKVLRK